MHVLQVLTGKETEIKRCLRDIGIEAYVPQERYSIRSGGVWKDQLKTVFPSYVFVSLNLIYTDYYRIKKVTGVIRLLELNGGAATELTKAEEKMIRSICSNDEPMPISNVEIEGDRITPLDGPLKTYSDAGYDIKYDKHQRKALLFPLDSINKEIKLSFHAVIKSPSTSSG
jgi:Transcription antiterminator